MIQDINIDNRKLYILYSDSKYLLYPGNHLYPSDDLYPGEYTQIANVVQGTAKLNEVIVDNEIKFGQLYASSFEVQVYDTPDISGKYILVYQEDNGVNKGIFFGKIISCKQDNLGLDRTIIAYDTSYWVRDINMAPWWENFWSNRQSATIKECRDSLCANVGVASEDVELPNDLIRVQKNVELSYISFADVLSMLCELNGCFPHFDRDGYLEFIMLDTEEQSTDITGLYEGINSSFEDFVTDEITGIQFFDSDNDLKYTYGNPTNVYKMSSNIFTYSMGTQQLDAIASTLLDYMSELSYTPANVKMIVGDLNYHLGQRLHTSKGDFYIFENNYSASQLIEESIIAKGTQKRDAAARGLGNSMIVVNEKIARVQYDVEQLSIEFADTAAGLSSRITQNAESITSEVTRATGAESGLSSRITQNANSIALKVSKGDVSSQLSVETGQITLSSGRLIINTGNFQINSQGIITAYNANLTGGVLNLGGSRSGEIKLYNSNNYLTGLWNKSKFEMYDGTRFEDVIIRMNDEGIKVYNDDEDVVFEAGPDGAYLNGEFHLETRYHTCDIERDGDNIIIKFDDDNYIDGTGAGGAGGMHFNADAVTFSVDDLRITEWRDGSYRTGYTGSFHYRDEYGDEHIFHFLHGILIDWS